MGRNIGALRGNVLYTDLRSLEYVSSLASNHLRLSWIAVCIAPGNAGQVRLSSPLASTAIYLPVLPHQQPDTATPALLAPLVTFTWAEWC